MANGQITALVRFVLTFVYGKVIDYICRNPELDGEDLRARIKSVFGTSLSAKRLDQLLAIARSRCSTN